GRVRGLPRTAQRRASLSAGAHHSRAGPSQPLCRHGSAVSGPGRGLVAPAGSHCGRNMANNAARSQQQPARCLPRLLPHAIAAVAAVLAFGGCSSKVDNNPATVTATNPRLTDAQRKNIQLYTVAPSRFRRTVETTAAVDFDNDQATSVLAPFSGPVSRTLVSIGDEVTQGQALATVDSPDFATAISTYQKAIATARTNRRLADLDKDLVQHNGVSQR